MSLVRTASILGFGLALSLSAAAARAAEPPRPASEGRTIGGAFARPIRDLNLLREKVPTALAEAGKSPYGPPADCAAVEAEIAALSEALGPDVDASAMGGNGNPGEALVATAVRSTFSLPYRSVVRRLTGAEKRDQAFRQAVLAGMVRRGYLKGVRSQMACDVAPVETYAAAADAFATETSARTPDTLVPSVEQGHDGREVANVDRLVEQGPTDETLVGEGAVPRGEDKGHLLFSEGGG